MFFCHFQIDKRLSREQLNILILLNCLFLWVKSVLKRGSFSWSKGLIGNSQSWVDTTHFTSQLTHNYKVNKTQVDVDKCIFIYMYYLVPLHYLHCKHAISEEIYSHFIWNLTFYLDSFPVWLEHASLFQFELTCLFLLGNWHLQ